MGFEGAGIYKILAGSIEKNGELEIEPINTTESISSIIEDNDKNLWYATPNNGIYQINHITNKTRYIGGKPCLLLYT